MNKIIVFFSVFLTLIIILIAPKASSLALSFKGLRPHYGFKSPYIFIRWTNVIFILQYEYWQKIIF